MAHLHGNGRSWEMLQWHIPLLPQRNGLGSNVSSVRQLRGSSGLPPPRPDPYLPQINEKGVHHSLAISSSIFGVSSSIVSLPSSSSTLSST